MTIEGLNEIVRDATGEPFEFETLSGYYLETTKDYNDNEVSAVMVDVFGCADGCEYGLYATLSDDDTAIRSVYTVAFAEDGVAIAGPIDILDIAIYRLCRANKLD